MDPANGNRTGSLARAAIGASAFVVLVPLAGYAVAKPLGWNAFGEYLGAVGMLCVIASLLLMLRFAALTELCGGLESMYRLHRGFGLAGYFVLLAHPLALAHDLGWQALDPIGKSWGFAAGWIGLLALMATLLFTFVLRPAGYAKWRNLHWLTAGAFVAMVGHVVYYQRDWSLPAIVFGDAILLAGLLAPALRYFVIDRGIAAAGYRVETVNRPIPGVIDVRLQPTGRPLAVTPGQFVFVRFLPGRNYAGCAHFHPFTASGVFDGGVLRLSIKSAGPCTEMMQSLEPGAEARLQGPFGHLFENVRQNVHVWIAGGIGITPFLARARMLETDGGTVKLFYLYPDEGTAAFVDELREIAREKPNFQVYPVITHGVKEVAVTVLDAMLPPWDDKSYVLCGPPGLTEAMHAYLGRHGVPPDRIHDEKFDFR